MQASKNGTFRSSDCIEIWKLHIKQIFFISKWKCLNVVTHLSYDFYTRGKQMEDKNGCVELQISYSVTKISLTF